MDAEKEPSTGKSGVGEVHARETPQCKGPRQRKTTGISKVWLTRKEYQP